MRRRFDLLSVLLFMLAALVAGVLVCRCVSANIPCVKSIEKKYNQIESYK